MNQSPDWLSPTPDKPIEGGRLVSLRPTKPLVSNYEKATAPKTPLKTPFSYPGVFFLAHLTRGIACLLTPKTPKTPFFSRELYSIM
jgi:hypothetical protein